MKTNNNLTVKERNLIKGAIRRVFSRSELRKAAIEASRIDHHDPERPRVKKWSLCPICKVKTPTYLMECDHINPIIPVGLSLEEMSWDEVINNVWCDIINLLAICKTCHHEKSKIENAERRRLKKLKTNKR